jgi:hypothetical protein
MNFLAPTADAAIDRHNNCSAASTGKSGIQGAIPALGDAFLAILLGTCEMAKVSAFSFPLVLLAH